MSGNTLIECRALTLGYEGTTVVEGLSFSVSAGDYLYIIGENGSGKSTLVRALLGLIRPMKGEIRLGGGLRHSEIGYLPQQTAVQRDFPAAVSEIVLSGCLNRCGMRPWYSRAEREEAARSMERLGISELSGKSYRELSGGQQQRVLLCRALSASRRLMLLDEPTAGLDSLAARELYGLVEELNRGGLTVIMVSHDLEAAAKYATHVLHMGHEASFARREDAEAWLSMRSGGSDE